MAIDVKTPNSPGWWLDKLSKKLAARLPELNRLQAYVEGDPPPPEGVENMRSAYEAIRKIARVNLAESAVTAVSDRIAVRAVRTAVATDSDGDDLAMSIWRDNNLDIELSDVIENMLGLRDGYMIVGLDPDDDDRVVITGEDPRQVVTIHNPLRQSEVRAALKMFHDPDEQRDYAYLYIAGEAAERDTFGRVTAWANARRYVATKARRSLSGKLAFSSATWEWDAKLDGAEGAELNHRFVPVVRFRNRNGISEFERHTDTLDRINHGILQRMVISLYQAYRLRAISVDDEDAPEVDPETNQEIDYEDLLTSDPGAFLKLPLGAKLWESAQADMSGILSSVKDDVLYFMEETKTPLPAISDAVQQSAEGAANIKEGNQFKTERTQKRVAASLAVVYMIAFMCLEESDRSKRGSIRIDYHPTNRPSLSEKYDAFSKSTDLPLETRMAEILQFDPERIAMAKAQKLQESLMGEPDGPSNAPSTGSTSSS
ncbi:MULTISPECIES: phage portal protein [unclassified Microbacterium]|uniref:phage portal protein n=1 Tax=unclassified Microbacterium TaxID=2609290 RepID=UPI003869A3F6